MITSSSHTLVKTRWGAKRRDWHRVLVVRGYLLEQRHEIEEGRKIIICAKSHVT